MYHTPAACGGGWDFDTEMMIQRQTIQRRGIERQRDLVCCHLYQVSTTLQSLRFESRMGIRLEYTLESGHIAECGLSECENDEYSVKRLVTSIIQLLDIGRLFS